jgi:hypothetical protein
MLVPSDQAYLANVCNEITYRFIHKSVQHPVAYVIEVTINTVYATLFINPLLEDVPFIATCFGSVEPSSGSICMILRKLLYLQQTKYRILKEVD